MGKATKKKTKVKAKAADGRIMPTEQTLASGDFVSAGMAYARVPVIDTMLKRGMIGEREHIALGYYRDQASQAEDDAKRMSVMAPEKVMGGGRGYSGGGYIPADYCDSPATLETARIERDLGILQPIARAIAVDDTTLSQWCIRQHGGRERYNGKGQFIAIVPNMARKAMALALQDLKMAAHRIVR